MTASMSIPMPNAVVAQTTRIAPEATVSANTPTLDVAYGGDIHLVRGDTRLLRVRGSTLLERGRAYACGLAARLP
jgi:hypothetical protein